MKLAKACIFALSWLWSASAFAMADYSQFYGMFRCSYVSPADNGSFDVGDEIMVGVNAGMMPDITWIGSTGTGDTYREDCTEIGDRVTCGGGTLLPSQMIFDEKSKHLFRILYRQPREPNALDEWACGRVTVQSKIQGEKSKYP